MIKFDTPKDSSNEGLKQMEEKGVKTDRHLHNVTRCIQGALPF